MERKEEKLLFRSIKTLARMSVANKILVPVLACDEREGVFRVRVLAECT
jgi:hypothetical protein